MNSLIKREYDYALRICAYLAGRYKKGLVPISKLSKTLLLTRPFTTKIVYKLKNEKILNTVQGKDGGIELVRHPDDITLYDILEAMGYNSAFNECLAKGHDCPMENNCELHKFFAEQEKLFMDALKSKALSLFKWEDHQLKHLS